MNPIQIALTDNDNPLEQMFALITPHCATEVPHGKIDLQQATMLVDITDLNFDAMIIVLEAVVDKFYCGWNLLKFEMKRGVHQVEFPINAPVFNGYAS